ERPARELGLALGRTSYAVYRRRHKLRRWLETEAGKAMRRVTRGGGYSSGWGSQHGRPEPSPVFAGQPGPRRVRSTVGLRAAAVPGAAAGEGRPDSLALAGPHRRPGPCAPDGGLPARVARAWLGRRSE